MRQLRIKKDIIDPFLIPHQANLTGANIAGRFIESTNQIVLILDTRTSFIEQIFNWDGNQQQFNDLMVHNVEELVNKHLAEQAHQAAMDVILQRKQL